MGPWGRSGRVLHRNLYGVPVEVGLALSQQERVQGQLGGLGGPVPVGFRSATASRICSSTAGLWEPEHRSGPTAVGRLADPAAGREILLQRCEAVLN